MSSANLPINPEDEVRIIIRVRVTDIPGDRYRRDVTLGELCSESGLFRPIKHQITPDGYDHVVIPPGFDSEKPVGRWFIYDLNVKGPKTREELLAIPHKVYLACKNKDDWVFVPRDTWLNAAKNYCTTYTWGGRVEQEWLAKIKDGLTV